MRDVRWLDVAEAWKTITTQNDANQPVDDRVCAKVEFVCQGRGQSAQSGVNRNKPLLYGGWLVDASFKTQWYLYFRLLNNCKFCLVRFTCDNLLFLVVSWRRIKAQFSQEYGLFGGTEHLAVYECEVTVSDNSIVIHSRITFSCIQRVHVSFNQ